MKYRCTVCDNEFIVNDKRYKSCPICGETDNLEIIGRNGSSKKTADKSEKTGSIENEEPTAEKAKVTDNNKEKLKDTKSKIRRLFR